MFGRLSGEGSLMEKLIVHANCLNDVITSQDAVLAFFSKLVLHFNHPNVDKHQSLCQEKLEYFNCALKASIFPIG